MRVPSFNALPRVTRECLVEATHGRGAATPMLFRTFAPRLTPASLGIAAAVVVGVFLMSGGVGNASFGSLDAAFLLPDSWRWGWAAVFAIVGLLAGSILRLQAALAGSPLPSGVFLFPRDVVDTRRQGFISCPLVSLTDVSTMNRYKGSTYAGTDVMFEWTDGSIALPFANMAAAEAALEVARKALQAAREGKPIDPASDPFARARGADGTIFVLDTADPTGPRLVPASAFVTFAPVLGVVIGFAAGAVGFDLRNAASDGSAFAAAGAVPGPDGFDHYLELGGARRDAAKKEAVARSVEACRAAVHADPDDRESCESFLRLHRGTPEAALVEREIVFPARLALTHDHLPGLRLLRTEVTDPSLLAQVDAAIPGALVPTQQLVAANAVAWPKPLHVTVAALAAWIAAHPAGRGHLVLAYSVDQSLSRVRRGGGVSSWADVAGAFTGSRLRVVERGVVSAFHEAFGRVVGVPLLEFEAATPVEGAPVVELAFTVSPTGDEIEMVGRGTIPITIQRFKIRVGGALKMPGVTEPARFTASVACPRNVNEVRIETTREELFLARHEGKVADLVYDELVGATVAGLDEAIEHGLAPDGTVRP